MVETIKLKEDYIRLGRTSKAAGLVQPGVDAKYTTEDGLVSVNGETVFQRGKKLVDGDTMTYGRQTIRITRQEPQKENIHDD